MKVDIVRGFGGWWIFTVLRPRPVHGAYKSSGSAIAAALRRGYRVRRVEKING